jgi:outer membrane protein
LGYTTFAQMKIGYINTQKLLELMPVAAKVDSALNAYAQQLQQQQQAMMQELNDKRVKYEEDLQNGEMAKSVMETRESEILDLQRRVQSFQQTAQEDLSQRQQKLYKPLIEQVENAINEVAKENGYRYVFESSTGNILYSVDEDDLMPLVKKKLDL